ncbi:WD40 repeat domain-containing protein [Acetobacteraceae bacterium ESL0709]|nr:WD40 repeat domain-containing protein [Acetobacteraceae bacterium ESL0697]MDF7677537.1 WD40 repeat domain-containing protein [Acetobacteraceae bacterium ESL0709]
MTPKHPLSHEVLATRGAERRFESPIVGVKIARDGKNAAALTADGEVILINRQTMRETESWLVETLHDGGLSLARDCAADSFLTGGEDGRVLKIRPDGSHEELYKGKGWIETLESTPGHYAFSIRKDVMLRDAEGKGEFKTLEHPSTVTGLAFDAKGLKIAASHYNGVSLWFVKAKESTPRSYEWKGSHIHVAVHPEGEAIVTAMQENELHGWRLSDGHNMRMSGYPRQVHSMSFTRKGKWLATSGADAAVLWPFFGGGPMGKPPLELARLPGLFSSAVLAHPTEEIVAVGYEDGAIIIAEIGDDDHRAIPVCRGAKSKGVDRGAVTSLCFSDDGGMLIFGTEEGYCGVVDLTAQS